MTTYRYRMISPNLDRLAYETTGTLTGGLLAPQPLRDMTYAAPLSADQKTDLDEFMARQGWEYLSTDPATTVADAFAAATSTQVSVHAAGALVGKRGAVNFIGATSVVDNPGSDRVDVTIPSATPLASAAPADITKAAASVGVGVTAARADHKHDISTAAASTIGTANSEGTATSLARSDHGHDHGAQTSGTLHAAVIAGSTSGFMTGADKTKLDGIASGAEVNAAANVGLGTGTIYRDKSGATLNLKSIKAGTNITITNNADDVEIAATGGGGAPVGASYVVLGVDGTLTSERVLTGTASQISVTDGGAGGNVTLALDSTVVRVGGQIGGTGTSPTITGIRETSGPTLLTIGTINDGEYLKRVGSTLVSGTPAGGSGNAVDVTVDFGASFSHYATATVTGQTWVTGTSKIVATVKAAANKAMETAIFQFAATVSDLVVGTGFTLSVFTPVRAKGTYTFSCVGV